MAKILQSTHKGELHIGDITIPCYVLEDGRRVLSGRGMQGALNLGQTRGQKLNRLANNPNIKPLINNDLVLGISNPIEFKSTTNTLAFGYEADALVELCDALMQARKMNVLPDRYVEAADQAEILIRSFAKVGIIALIDEATGYQYDREKDELQKILKKYISEELLPWQKRFPDEFYREIFRLNGWYFTAPEISKAGRPGVIGTWTKKYIYSVLPPGVLHALLHKTPRNMKGKLTRKLHQSLTREEGIEHLNRLIVSVVTLMNISDDWKEFNELWNKKFGQQVLPLDDVMLIEPKVEENPKEELPPLSEFNQNLQLGLDWNPKAKN